MENFVSTSEIELWVSVGIKVIGKFRFGFSDRKLLSKRFYFVTFDNLEYIL